MEKKNIPELRFKGFEDGFDSSPIGEISYSYSGGTPSVGNNEYYNGSIPFIRSAEINSDSTELFITQKGLDNSAAKLVSKGDILYALYGATSGEVGRSKIKGAINQAILAIITKDKYDSEFIAQWLRNNKKNIIESYLQGGQGNLSGSIVKKIVINLPTYKEQKKIGKLLNNLDKKLELEKEKHKKLKDFKKSMLEDMFPKEGESIPKLRFDGFDGEWKEFKINDLFSSIESGNRLPKEMLVEGDIPYVIATLSNNGIIDYIDIDTKDFHNNRMKLFKKNSITFSIDNPDAIFVQEQRFFASNIMRILHNDSYNLYHLKFIAESLIRLTRGFNWSFKFSGPVVMNASIKIPSKFSNSIDFDEIEKIGKVIYTLDNLSDNSKVLIKKIEDFKKSLMEKMFV